MIERINLKSVATYNNDGATLDSPKKVNFIYGNNGAGKTTISEVIRKEEDFPSCSIEWKNEKMATYVYNRNFVNENFHLDNPIKGIFTLGKDSVDHQNQIDVLKVKIQKHKEAVSDLYEKYKKKTGEKDSLVEEFKIKCWGIKKEVDDEFKDLIEGYRNSKDKFMKKCIEASRNTERKLKSIDELKTKKKSLYDRPMEKVEFYQSLLFDEALENRQVFNRKIIGKDDVDLAQLITRLNISDWVQQGYEIVRKNEDVCPFCQQTLPEQFEVKLSSYFDQTYIELIDELNNTTNDYEEKVGFLISQIDSLSKRDTTFINIEKVENLRKLIKAKFDENLLLKRRRNLVELLNLLRFQKQLGKSIWRYLMPMRKFENTKL